MPVPHVGLAGLHTLAKLLKEVGGASQCATMGAALVSHEASRRDVYAPPVHVISVRSVLGLVQGKDSRDAQWPELPEETRQALAALIVQLFVEQANGASASQPKKAGMMQDKIGAPSGAEVCPRPHAARSER